MNKPTFESAIMNSTSTDEARACARLVFINPASLEDLKHAHEILENNLSLEEAQALFK